MNSIDKERIVTKEELIQIGLQYLEGVGISNICNVCISNGGSCCMKCSELEDGIGCKQRNTSCTAWLCGYLKFVFFKAGLLNEWDQFWEQIPGRDYRTDYTPSVVLIKKRLQSPNLQSLGQAFGKDLAHFIKKHNHKENNNDLKFKLDLYVRFSTFSDIDSFKAGKTELEQITADFYSFKLALQEYKNSQMEN